MVVMMNVMVMVKVVEVMSVMIVIVMVEHTCTYGGSFRHNFIRFLHPHKQSNEYSNAFTSQSLHGSMLPPSSPPLSLLPPSSFPHLSDTLSGF